MNSQTRDVMIERIDIGVGLGTLSRSRSRSARLVGYKRPYSMKTTRPMPFQPSFFCFPSNRRDAMHGTTRWVTRVAVADKASSGCGIDLLCSLYIHASCTYLNPPYSISFRRCLDGLAFSRSLCPLLYAGVYIDVCDIRTPSGFSLSILSVSPLVCQY